MTTTLTHESYADTRSLIAGVLSTSPEDSLREIHDRGIWSRVALDAWRQRVGGVLLHRLCELGATIPEDAQRELNANARHVSEANRVRLDRVMPVLDAFSHAGIDCLLLKGAALLTSIYRDFSVRPMVDVDLLIDASNADAADAVLQQFDWRAGAALVRPDFFPRFHCEREYLTRSEPAVRIDLHVRPFRPLRFSRMIPRFASEDSVDQTELCGQTVYVPNPELMLVHLAAHAAFHGASALRWLYDIHAWLRHCDDDLDVDAIVRKCLAWKLTHPVRVALIRTRKTFGPIGRLDSILHAMSTRAGVLDRLVLWQAPHGDTRHAMDVCVNAITIPGWRRRFSYLAAVSLPDRAHLGQIYPYRHPAWPAVAHAARVLRLATKPFHKSIAS